jgi:antitoxin VapB
MSQVAKLFTNGRSQAVRLPATFRFEGKEVYIRQDPVTGDVTLSQKPANWDGFLALVRGADIPPDFLSPAERNQAAPRPDPFADWVE